MKRAPFGFQVRLETVGTDARPVNNEVAFSTNKARAIAKAEDLAKLNFHAYAVYSVRDTRTGATIYRTGGGR